MQNLAYKNPRNSINNNSQETYNLYFIYDINILY